MVNANHILTASILVCLMALSPMSISILHDTAPRIASLPQTID